VSHDSCATVRLEFTGPLRRLDIFLPDGTPYPGYIVFGTGGVISHMPDWREAGALNFGHELMPRVHDIAYDGKRRPVFEIHTGCLPGVICRRRSHPFRRHFVRATVKAGPRGPVVIWLGRGGYFGQIVLPAIADLPPPPTGA